MTTMETLFVYGLLGLVISWKLEKKIDRILVVIFMVAFLSPLPYMLFTVGIYGVYRLAYNGIFRIKLYESK